MRRMLAGVMVIVLAAGVGAAIARAGSRSGNGRQASQIPQAADGEVLPPGQSKVVGTVDELSATDSVADPLSLPLTVESRERGAGRLRIEQALVDGQRATLEWDAGTPLTISNREGRGGLDLGPASVTVGVRGPTWALDGRPRGLIPGQYRLDGPVAVGAGGLAAPRDGVDLTADDRTVLTATAGVIVHLDARPVHLEGPGRVKARGQLQIRTRDGVRTASDIDFGPGPFVVDVAPDGQTLRLEATLQDRTG